MHLVVIYGIKTTDYAYLDQFYPTRRLSEECANRSIPLRFLFVPDVDSFLAEKRTQKEIQEILCLIRGIVPIQTIASLEQAGLRTINSLSASIRANDKLVCAHFLEQNGWPTPRTESAQSMNVLTNTFPLVAKPRYGSRGEGVHLVYNQEQIDALPKDTLVQEYIETSFGRDLRFFFAGGTIIAIAERRSVNGSFISNTSGGGHMSIPSFGSALPEPWARMVLDIARIAGLWYGTVDFLYLEPEKGNPRTQTESPDKSFSLTICELNASPGFETLEKDCGYNIAGSVLDRMIAYFSPNKDLSSRISAASFDRSSF